ncbi:MAG TPA: hypothetical protein VGQ48_11255 [Gemmatimonadales bacterium]|nr:hypothetical protein [Gemmatimonadales bacterium]
MIGTVREWLARGVLLPLYRAQRALRPSRRAALRHCTEGRRFRSDAVGWSDARKRDWMLAQLRVAVRRAYRETSFYRAHLDAAGFDPAADFHFADFARLPVLDREALQSAGPGLRSRAMASADLRRDATGGSTGTPTEIWMGPEELGWRESGMIHFMERIGLPSGARTAFLWGHHLDPVASDGFKERMYSFIENVRWFECLRLSPAQLRLDHRELERWRPRCLIAYASALGALAEVVREERQRPRYPTHCFVTGAEKLMPRHRELIEQVYGRPVHERYGSRDVGLMAFQVVAAGDADFEVDWANVFIEPETPGDNSPILVTKLHADGMPMLRYRVGDVAHFPSDSRPGHPALRLREILGREADRVWLADGGWVDGITFPHMFKDQPVREFQVVQRRDLSVELRLVPARGFTPESQHQILQTVRANLPGLEVRLALMEDIPRTRASKLRPVVSER